MSEMGVDALRDNLSNGQRSYLWDIVIPSIPGGGDEEALEVRVRSTVKPGRSFGEILIPYKATAGFKVPGKLTLTHIWPCVFVEGTDRKVFDAIYYWKRLIQNERRGRGYPDDVIKRNIYLRLLDQNGSTTDKTRLIGCYPQAVDDVPIAYDDEAVILYNVTFSYDNWTPDN